ncbi:MAG: hypothetical protein HC893_16525 [Chloroflexaceae bacterium]|nr:hypothetical protein [Chloroflexaceae bacterium]
MKARRHKRFEDRWIGDKPPEFFQSGQLLVRLVARISAALIVPIETPVTQSGVKPASLSARNAPT